MAIGNHSLACPGDQVTLNINYGCLEQYGDQIWYRFPESDEAERVWPPLSFNLGDQAHIHLLLDTKTIVVGKIVKIQSKHYVLITDSVDQANFPVGRWVDINNPNDPDANNQVVIRARQSLVPEGTPHQIRLPWNIEA